MHFAALANVGASVRQPREYYRQNVANTLNLVEVMCGHDVKTMIFSSSAAVFGNPQTPLISEEHPCRPINPYGSSKLMVEQILADYDNAYGLRSCCLRYFNAAGAAPDGTVPLPERPEHNLIPRILGNILAGTSAITLNGTDYPTTDGTCVRDYLHVLDIAAAHVAALDRLLGGAPSAIYNLGTGSGFSIKQVLAAIEEVTGRKVEVTVGPRRVGDPPRLVAGAEKAAEELGWRPQHADLETMIAHQWMSMKQWSEQVHEIS